MRFMRLPGCLGLCLGLWVTSSYADEWRPVNSARPAPASQTSQATSYGVQLGRPVAIGVSTPAHDRQTTGVQTVSLKPSLGTPHGDRVVVRAQGPDAYPATPEEQYNCGVVTEGPPSGHPILSGPKRWFGGLFSGSQAVAGDVLAPVTGRFGNFESDHAFDSFISPVTNPFFFEDPRSLTELRPIVMYQKTPGNNPLFRGGDIEFYALQARLAFTERFSLVLHKLGYVAIQPDGIGPTAHPDSDGFAELQIGPKYTFWRDDCTNTIAAIGVNFEIPVGNQDVFQDTGDGAVTPYITAGQKLGNFHLLGTFGYRFGFDNERSDSLFTSAHIDYSFFDRIYPLVEFNWYHYTNNGNARAANFEGQDLFNFGSNSVEGNDVLTMAAGVRFKITEGIQAGVAYEFPLTNQDDLLDYRITADIIFRY